VFQPGPGIPLGISAHLPSREVTEREVTVYPFPPAYWELIGGHHRAYVGLDAALMTFIAFKFADPEGSRGEVRFLTMLQLGASARENVKAVRFCLDLQAAEKVEFSGPLFPPELIRPGPRRFIIPDEWIGKLNAMQYVYEGVVSLEERLGVPLPVHAPPLTAEEIQELGTCLAILSDRQVPITFEQAQGEAPVDVAGAEMQRLRNHPPFVFPVTGKVFGTEVTIGRAVGTLPDVRVVEIPRLTITPNPTVTLKLFAIDPEAEIVCRLLGDDEDPPPDAIRAPEQPQA
jgi:hypothetical protein